MAPIMLTEGERAELDGLACSTRTEYRLRQRARIVLLAADGMETRAVARTVGCTTGTASKWRVRYAGKRLAGLDETGDRGAEPEYTAETGRRILSVLDGPPPPGHARWTAPLIAQALGDGHERRQEDRAPRAAHPHRRRTSSPTPWARWWRPSSISGMRYPR